MISLTLRIEGAQIWKLTLIGPACLSESKDQGGTMGQEAVELICQSEQKTQQNATISLWPLFSTEMDLIVGFKKS